MADPLPFSPRISKGTEKSYLLAASTKPPPSAHQPGRQRRVSSLSRFLGHMTHTTPVSKAVWVIAVIELEKNPGITVARRYLKERFMKMARFRSKLVTHRWGGHWEEVAVEDGYHFEVACYGRPASRADVDSVVSQQNAWAFDPNKPLWKVVHIPETEQGKSVIIAVINHAIGDGVALVNVFIGLCEDMGENKDKAAHAGRRKKGPDVGIATRTSMYLWGIYEGITAPFWRHDQSNKLKLKGDASPKKLVASSPDVISLAKIKEIASVVGHNVSVNDVIMAAYVRTLRAFFVEIGDERIVSGKQRVRSQFPINVRSKGEGPTDRDGEPNNRFGFGLITLPMVYENSTDLILKLQARIDKVKINPAPRISLALLPGNLATIPRPVLLKIILDATNMSTCQLSNVPGPQASVSLAGVRVTRFSFYLFSTLGMYVGIASYNGDVACSVNIDASIGVDPHQVVKHWTVEFDKMYEEICGATKVP